MLKFFAEKIWVAFALHIFSAKNIRILYIESAKTVKEMTLNELVKLTTLWTTGSRISYTKVPSKIGICEQSNSDNAVPEGCRADLELQYVIWLPYFGWGAEINKMEYKLKTFVYFCCCKNLVHNILFMISNIYSCCFFYVSRLFS